jgi:DNA processing protein
LRHVPAGEHVLFDYDFIHLTGRFCAPRYPVLSPMLDDQDPQFWIAFSRIPSVGRARLGLLESRFGSLQVAWSASQSELVAAGLDRGVVASIVEHRTDVDPQREIDRIRAAGVTVLTWHDSNYPMLLREVDDLPPILYARGPIGATKTVTVLGTRKPTAYGREVAKHLSGELAEAGVTIVSGITRGVEGLAHRTALEAGGRTLAVLGCGVDVAYPPEHASLIAQIVEQGAVISEYPLGTKPEERHFPRRNRLLSGLSVATLVIEAGEGSGP